MQGPRRQTVLHTGPERRGSARRAMMQGNKIWWCRTPRGKLFIDLVNRQPWIDLCAGCHSNGEAGIRYPGRSLSRFVYHSQSIYPCPI